MKRGYRERLLVVTFKVNDRLHAAQVAATDGVQVVDAQFAMVIHCPSPIGFGTGGDRSS